MASENQTPRRGKSPYKDRLVRAEALKAEAEATLTEQKLREVRPHVATRDLRILGTLGPQVAAVTISVFSRWNRIDAALGTSLPRNVFINAEQGHFGDTFAVYDVLRVSQANGGPDVTVQTTGLAETKAAIVMQAAKRRVMTPRSWLILQEIQPNSRRLNSAEGQEAVLYMKSLENRGWKLLLERSNLDIADVKEKTEYGRQWWLSAEEALKYGLIDEIGTVMPNYAGYTPDPELAAQPGDSWQTRLEKAKLRLLIATEEIGRTANTLERSSAENAGKHYLFGEINTESCTGAQESLLNFAQRDLPDVEMIISSPGGSCFDGSGLMDVIEQTTAKRNFTTTIFGECASMAGFIAMTGKRRIMARNAAFLIHRTSTVFGQSSSHMDDNTRNMERLENLLFPFMAERTGGKLPLAELQERCKRSDWWLTAEEALACGLVHELI
jgi:ATP-dependent Clp protease protease subunit